MTRRNRDFSSTPQPTPMPEGFVGGSNATEAWGVVRIIDGHNPAHIGIEGSNVHVPAAETATGEWHEEFTQYDPE